MKEELINKVRLYMSTHTTDAFTSALLEGEISRFDIGITPMDTFKVNINLLLQINIDNEQVS